MSYNTRRTATGGGPGGRSAPTQVNYHQQPSRPSSNTQQSRNPGYSTTQQPSYNSSSQPAYTTQQQGYTTSTQNQAPQAKPPQAQPPAAQTPVAAQPPSQPQPQVKTSLPSTPTTNFKQEPLTPADTPKMDTAENGDGTQPKPFWKKKTYVKVSNKVRKARQNAKLRRVLNPKNALTFLNELRPGNVKFNVREESGWGFIASVDIDGKSFSGNGLTVSKAKVQASEQALRYLLLEQLAKSQTTPPGGSGDTKEDSKEEPEPMDAAEESESGEEPKLKKPKVEQPEDEVPWGSLAAFALHKLFAEWQKDGTDLSLAAPPEKYDEDIGEEAYFTRRPVPPEFGYPRRLTPPPYGRGRGFGPYPPRGPPPPGFGMPRRVPREPVNKFFGNARPAAAALPLGGNIPPVILPMKKIPEDANKRHPVMLLNQLKPNIVYNETREGEAPHVFFKISLELDGKEFIGRGKSKKDAKKNAAVAALAPLGVIYPSEEVSF